MGMKNGLWHHQFFYLSALESRIILWVCQKPSLACLWIISRFKPLGGFSGLKEPISPNDNGGTATQSPPSTSSVFISSHHSPSLGRKRVAYNFCHCHIVVLSCQQRWYLDVSWQAWGHHIMSFFLFLLQRTQWNSMYYFACYLGNFRIWKNKFCLKSPLLQLWYGWYFQTCMYSHWW